MALITLQEVSLSFGAAPLLDKVNLQIEAGERVCLVGRNGEGKSSLLKLLAGDLLPDSGRRLVGPEVRIARLDQEVDGEQAGTVYDMVASGLGESMNLLARHHSLLNRLAVESGPELLRELADVEQRMETSDAWGFQQRIDTALSRLQLDADLLFRELSGGMKRRVLLARALVCDPDLLLLDEPTNHLDIEAIAWLEEFLANTTCAQILISHDREFIKKLATRVLDLDRGKIANWPGDYRNYLRRKDELLNAEQGQQAEFDRKLAEEEVWIRQGIKARRTRNQGRVRRLVQMREERQARREAQGKVRMEISRGGVSGKLVAVLKKVSFAYGQEQEPLIRELTTTILRGDKVGLIGPNGVGKTTLLRLILGKLSATSGEVKLGTNLLPAYFDQQRAQLDEEKSVIDNLSLGGGDFMEINGRQRHVISHLRDFLFTPDRARSPVKILSGGERNRLLLARLFTKPANILVLDEPTNDLDMETLELLEELLLEFSGTVLVVSHDRAFLNNLVTSSLVFEGNGRVTEYAGGYDDWLAQRPEKAKEKPRSGPTAVKKKSARPKSEAPRKLTFKENRELEGLPGEIEAMEAEQAELYKAMADPALYQEGDGASVAGAKERVAELEGLLASAYERWEELEAVQERFLAGKG